MRKEVFFHSKGAKLSGTLTLPDGISKPPACLFIGGSFPQTRDGNLDNSKTDWFPVALPERNLFYDEAKILENIGIATLRYDKRGCGKSEGNFNLANLFDLLDDAQQALCWLQSLPEIETSKIGVLGQSEGAVIALMLTAQNPDIYFYIWQGGIYQNLKDILRWQAVEFWKLPDDSINNFKRQMPLMYYIYQELEQIIVSAERGADFFSLGDNNWSFKLYLPLWKNHFDHVASSVVAQVKCPVLILHGALDHNTPPTEARKMEEALVQAGNPHVNTHILEGLDHSFRRLANLDEDFVSAMQKPLDVVMVEALSNWLTTIITSNDV